MVRQLYISLFLLLMLSATGCTGIARKVGPLSIEGAERLGTSGVEVQLRLPNHSRHTLKIRQAEATFYYHGEPLATAQLHGELQLKKRSEELLRSRWRVRAEDPTALIFLQKRLSEQRVEGLTLDYHITFKVGLIKKTFSDKGVELTEILRTFAPIKQPDA